MNNKPNWKGRRNYNDFSSYFKSIFKQRIQKISINAGFTCPNRDGSKSTGGCAYCNNNTFSPFYCNPKKTIKQQIDEGIDFFAAKYKTQKYLAYFQAYSNTYAPLSVLKKLYSEALENPSIIGLVIATRPDCIDKQKLNYIEQLAKKYYVTIEYGIESSLNETLKKINRSHTFEDTIHAIKLSANRGIHIGAHLILGLEGENYLDFIEHAKQISKLPINTLKLHQLQIIKNTKLEKDYLKNPDNYNLFTADSYINLVIDFLEHLNPDIIVERFVSESPSDLLIAPKWNRVKNFEIVEKIDKKLKEKQTWQGRLYDGIYYT